MAAITSGRKEVPGVMGSLALSPPLFVRTNLPAFTPWLDVGAVRVPVLCEDMP